MKIKYNFHRAENGKPRTLVWQSDPINRRGTVEEVFCDEDWFWANPNGRWMLHNQRMHEDEYDPGFTTLRFTPTHNDGNYNDCYVT